MGMQTCPRCGFRAALTVPEVEQALGVSDQTVRNYIKRGLFPGVETETLPGGVRYWIPTADLKLPAVRAAVAETRERAERKRLAGSNGARP